MITQILLTLSLITLIKSIDCINYCLNYLPSCECKSSERIECRNFQNFADLDFKISTNKKMPNLKHYQYMKIFPSNSLILDNSLNLADLNFDLSKFQLVLNNIEGFELTANPFLKYTHELETLLNVISINNSTFKFLYRQNEFDWFCDLVVKDNELNPIFSSFKSLYLGYNSPVDFSHKICPAVFKNSNLESIFISNLTLDNYPEFIPLSKIELNSKIRNFHIQSSEIYLDNSLLDKNVFKNVHKISIEFSNLTGMSQDVFKSFKHLKQINFWLFNFEHLIHSIGFDWIHFLNEDLKLYYDYDKLDKKSQKMKEYVSKKQIIIELTDEKGSYSYPDSDFCIFKNFPHSRLVYPLINSNRDLNCTCTIVWLIQFWKHANRDLRTSSVYSCFNMTTISFDLMILNCNFDKRLKACSNQTNNDLSSNFKLLSKFSLSKSSKTVFNQFLIVASFIICLYVNKIFF